MPATLRYLFLCLVLSWLLTASSFTIRVTHHVDAAADPALCTDGDPDGFAFCNLRSAFATCMGLQSDLASSESCTIQLPDDSLFVMNSTYGAITINGTARIHLIGGWDTRIQPDRYLSDMHIAHPTAFLQYNQLESTEQPTLTLSNVTVAGFNSTAGTGGAIYFVGAGALHLNNVIFVDNLAKSGGAVYVRGNNNGVVISNCSFLRNAADYGGAITFANNVVNATITGSLFQSCEATQYGGSVFVNTDNSGIAISECTFLNSSTAQGGGSVAIIKFNQRIEIARSSFLNSGARDGAGVLVAHNNTDITVADSTFNHNVAARAGGGILVYDTNLRVTVTGCEMQDCHALGEDGGAIYAFMRNAELHILDTDIAHCTATNSSAGAIYIEMDNPDNVIRGVNIRNCSALRSGGAIFMYSNQNFTLEDTTIDHCHAHKGGCINIEHDNNNFVLQRTTVSNCFAQLGGGIYVGSENTAMQITQVHFKNCSAVSLGGGLLSEAQNNYMVIDQSSLHNCSSNQGGGILLGRNEEFTISNSDLRGCRAEWGGGLMLYSSNVYVTLVNTTLTENYASDDGGGIYSTRYSSGLRIGGCQFDSNSAGGQGGGIFVESGNDLLLLVDADAAEKMLVFESEHPYEYEELIFGQNVSVPGALGYLVFFDPLCSIGNEDRVTLFRTDGSDRKVLFKVKGDGDWPGVSEPTLQLDVTEFRLEFTGHTSYYTPETQKSDKYFGFRAYIVPIFPQVSVKPTTFLDNRAGAGGGGAMKIYSMVRFAVFLNIHFFGNSADGDGGALFLRNALVGLTMQALVFVNNWSDMNGGAVCASSASYAWNVQNCNFTNNGALNGGGGVAFVTDNGIGGVLSNGNKIEFAHCRFARNRADYGAGIYLDQENGVYFYNTIIENNNATTDGGGVYMQLSNQLKLANCSVANNSAVSCGGGVSMAEDNTLTLNQTHFAFNTAGTKLHGWSVAFVRVATPVLALLCLCAL
jgi:predicted outer membrane repeat protein